MYRIDYTTDKLIEPLCEADLNWEHVSQLPGIDYGNLASVLSVLEDMRAIDDGKGRYRVMRLANVEPAADEDIVEAGEAWARAGCPMRPCAELIALSRAVIYRDQLQTDGERRVA
jgi:hypothetical protein